MAYELRADEGVRESIIRCARQQLDRAIEELSENIERDPVAAVHAARKAVKRERALLRMARGSMARKQRRRENVALREAARGLSSVRDADVVVETLDKLAERFAGQLPKAAFGAVRERLDADRTAERRRALETAMGDEAVQDLGAVRVRVDEWRLSGEGWPAIEPGLARTYSDGLKALKRAGKEPTLENLHTLRKRVKDLRYQLELLAAVSGATIAGQAEEAHHLTDLLGDDHDLAVLREAVLAHSADLAVDLDALLALIDYRRSELQTEAIHLAGRVYAEKRRAYMRRLRASWLGGRAAARATRERRPAKLAQRTRAPR